MTVTTSKEEEKVIAEVKMARTEKYKKIASTVNRRYLNDYINKLTMHSFILGWFHPS